MDWLRDSWFITKNDQDGKLACRVAMCRHQPSTPYGYRPRDLVLLPTCNDWRRWGR